MISNVMRWQTPRVLSFVLIALAMRMIVPAGWMVTPAGSTALVTMCTGQGVQNIRVDRETAPGRHDDNHSNEPHANTVCPFAALSTGAAGTNTVVLATPPEEIGQRAEMHGERSAFTPQSSAPRFATGPPGA